MRLISVWTCMGIAALLTALLSGLSFYQCGLEQPGRECFSAPLTDATTLEPVAEFNTLPNKPRLFRIRKTTASQKAIPVLFVHGHAGSHEQLRWLAEASIEREDNRTTHLEWFSLEMNEQFSALDAHLILQQAHSVNEALTFILHQQLSNASQSAIIIAHSMGGVVARTAFTLPNHPPGSVQTLITLATPHAIPPISIERDMVSLYETVNQFWRTADHWETSPFKNLAIVSIVGGTRDLQIQSQYSELTAIVPDSRGFTVYSSGIPGVWMDLTHESILWCQTCVEAIVHAVSESVAFLSVEERLFSFQRAFSLDARWDVNQLNQVRTQKKTKGRVWTNGVILNLKDLSHSLEPIQLNVPEHGNWTLRVLAVGVENELLGCMPSQMPPCALLNSQFVEIPQAEKSALFMDIVNVQHRYQEIVVHIHRVLDSSTSLLNLELVDSEKELVQQSVGENVGKKRASAPISSLSTLIVFPGIYESFFHYHVTSKLSCPPAPNHIQPVLFVKISGTPEEKLITNIASSRLSFQSNAKDGISVRVIAQPHTCPGTESPMQIQVAFRIDWWASLGTLSRRFAVNVVTGAVGDALVSFVGVVGLGIGSGVDVALSKAHLYFLAKTSGVAWCIYNVLAMFMFMPLFGGSAFPSLNSDGWSVLFAALSGCLAVLSLHGYFVIVAVNRCLEYILARMLPVSFVSIGKSPKFMLILTVLAVLSSTFLTSPSLISAKIYCITLFHVACLQADSLSSTGKLPDTSLPVQNMSSYTLRNLGCSSDVLFFQMLFSTPHAIASLKDGFFGWWREAGSVHTGWVTRGDVVVFYMDLSAIAWVLCVVCSKNPRGNSQDAKGGLAARAALAVLLGIYTVLTGAPDRAFWAHYCISLVLCLSLVAKVFVRLK